MVDLSNIEDQCLHWYKNPKTSGKGKTWKALRNYIRGGKYAFTKMRYYGHRQRRVNPSRIAKIS